MNFSKFSHSLLKNSLWVVIVSLFSALVVGCADDEAPFILPEQAESGYITLSLNCVENTRAEGDYIEDGKTDLHENLISDVTICLWAKGGDKPDDTATPDYVQTFTNIDKERIATLRIPLTTALRNKLFETSGTECHAFAAVNVGVPEGKFTIADYRNMAIESTFAQHRVQEDFAMDGDGVVKYDVATAAATGSIDLRRSASKITLALNVDNIVEQSVVVDGSLVTSKWQPDTEHMRVYVHGALAQSTLDPDLEATPSEAYFFDTASDKEYLFTDKNTDFGNANGNTEYPFQQIYPFYTYPHRWSAEPGDYATTYMTLSIPWRQVRQVETAEGEAEKYEPIPNSSWRTCYYQVPVIAADSDPLQLVRNVAYHVYLHVGLLGSFVPDEPLELEDLEYSAAEWGTEVMDVNIPDVRYLVVDQNDYTVNNESSLSIPFYTSHETIVTNATMTFYRYNYDDVGNELPVTINMAQNEESAKPNRGGAPVFTAEFDNTNKTLNVTHDLDIYEAYTNAGDLISFTQNDGPTIGKRNPKTRAEWNALVSSNNISYLRKKTPVEDEYSRVEFEITVQHKDMTGTTNFKEVIKITQYPGMYITVVRNYINENDTSFSYTGAEGNTFINGNNSDYSLTQGNPSGGMSTGWMTSIGLSTSYLNFNPNMYLVTVTTLPENTQYKIGDPRSRQINNNLGSGTSDVNGTLPTGEFQTPWASSSYTYIPNQVSNQPTVSSPVTVTGFRSGNAIEGGTRTIKYYYPTQEDEEHKMMISPKFRICSSYAGTTWILNRELSRRRAAAYQELGYAAGRWRLPTYGEVSFVMQLAAEYKIPRLFGTTGTTWYYWCANGLVCVPAKNASYTLPSLPGDANYTGPTGPNTNNTYPNGRNPYVQRSRFVYDEWYWGEADLPHQGTIGSADCVYTFTWGDREINFGTEL